MFWNQFARVVIAFALLSLPMAAQQPQDAPTHVTLQGVVQTPDKTPVPGASVHIVEQNSGKSWITWTDETGKFRLPELPAGKFHVDAAQIGFGTAAAEVAPVTEKSDDIILVLKIATAQEIAAANAASQAANAPTTAAVAPTTAPTTPGTTPPPTTDAAKNQTTTPPAADATKPTTGAKTDATKPATQTARNGRGGQNGQNGGGRGARGGGGFTGVDVNGTNGAATDTTDVTGGADTTGLGVAASSDATLLAGTVAQGASGGFPMMMGMGGEGGDPNNPNFPGQGGDNNGGIPGGVPGMTGGGGPGGGGGRGGPGGGGPGGGGRGAGGPGGGGRGGRGAQGPNGVPWGIGNAIRKRINTVHYTLNETLLDSAFDARTWQANGQEQAKLPFSNNRFGGSIGGPLRIPHVYDGRDKTFFFLNVNLGHGDNANYLTGNVPTALERAGNFCSSSTTGGPVALYNFATSSSTSLSTPRTPLANTGANNCDISGMNPSTLQPYINPTATALLALIPLPNQVPSLSSPNNYLLQVATPTNNQTISGRITQTISSKLNFGVQYNISQNQTSGQGLFPTETSSSSNRAQIVNLTFNQNISPRLINAIVVNFTRTRSNTINGFANNTNEEALLGIVGGSSNPLNFGLPGVSLNSSNGGLSYTGFSDAIPNLTRNETYYLQDTLTWTHAKHATHFGATIRRVQTNTDKDPNPRGSFTFTGLMTENFNATGQALPGTGSPLADFELGLPQGTAVQFGDSFNYLRSRAFIAYFTDDWKIKPRFTLTYGLRYELVLPATELFGHLADLDVNPANFALTQQVTPAANVGPFSGTLPASLIRPNYKNFAPRVSIAWRVPGKYFEANNGKHALIVRAGYNVFDNSNSYTGIDNHLLNQAPFAQNLQLNASTTAPLSIATGLPTTSTSTPINTYAVNPNYLNPIVQIWNVSLESQFIDGFTWQVSYIGTKGSRLDVYAAPNVLNVANNAFVASGGTLSAFNPSQTYFYDSSGASSIYNALQIRLQKRMRNGFTFTTIYTYSKSLDDSSSIGGSGQSVIQDFPNFSADRGLSSFDRRNVITGNATYELPFGERKRFAHKGTEAKILGNWRLSGSTTFQTGTPLQPTVNGPLTALTGSGGFSTRPDIFSECSPNLLSSQRTVSEFFNISCFAAPGTQFPASAGFPQFPQGGPIAPAGLAGNAGRDIVRGPSSIIVNMALAKTITLGRDGQKRLDLRWEANNIANHPNYSSIGLAVGTRSFGEVLGAGAMRTMQAVIRLNF